VGWTPNKKNRTRQKLRPSRHGANDLNSHPTETRGREKRGGVSLKLRRNKKGHLPTTVPQGGGAKRGSALQIKGAPGGEKLAGMTPTPAKKKAGTNEDPIKKNRNVFLFIPLITGGCIVGVTKGSPTTRGGTKDTTDRGGSGPRRRERYSPRDNYHHRGARKSRSRGLRHVAPCYEGGHKFPNDVKRT